MKVLVTGGGGFLGRALVRELLARGHAVSSVSRQSHPELERDGVRTFQADVADLARLAGAVEGHDAIVHAAARAGIWGPAADYVRANVEGTRNVLAAAQRHGVERLVHTSSPSVCFDGRDHLCAGNDLPYATRFLCDYPRTKAIAERLVLGANGHARLSTCVLRPHLLFGPGDPHLVPRLVARAQAGRLVRIGKGTNEVGLTFVENAACAHADALEALGPRARHAGRAYFLAQKEPVKLWDWIAELLVRLGIEPPRRALPLGLAYATGAACELFWKLTRRQGEPPMTRFVALQLARSHSYDLGPAERDFGYRERVGLREATERLVASLRTGS